MRTRAWIPALLLAAAPLSGLGAQGFPSQPPRPTRLSPVRFPPVPEATFPNGLELAVIERHEQPVVSIALSFRAGSSVDPGGKEGLSALVAELLSKGTASRSAEQIAAAIEGAGGSLAATSDEDFLTVAVDALSDQVPLAFELLGDVTRQSTFPASELELARTRAASALTLELSQPAAVAGRFFAAELYGRHPYGRSPTRESYQRISRDDVTQFAAQRLRPAGALLVVAGDVTELQARDLVRQAFADWHGAPPHPPAPAAPPAKPVTDILLVHRPGSAQSHIVVGNTTIGPADPTYYAARVATQVLGGGADARLFQILREQKGWTYGAYAALHRYRGLGYWDATAEVRTDVTDSALAELLEQVDRIRTTTIPDSELAAAKGYLVGSFPRTIETANQIATQVATAKLLGLGDEYLRQYRERLSAVTARAAAAAAARLYRRRALTIVVVGDAARITDRLQAIAPVRLMDLEGHPLTAAELRPPGASSARPVLDTAQFAAHRDSSRVWLQGKVVGFLVAEVRRAGDSLVYSEHSNLGNGALDQLTTVLMDPADGAVRQVDQVIKRPTLTADTRVSYGGGRVHGRSAAPQEDGTVKRYAIDTALPPGTMDESAVPFVVPALPLARGQVFTLNFFAPLENAQRVLTFRVSGPDTLTVAAGTYRAYRVDGTGSLVPVAMYVSTETPRRVLKTEFLGQPFVVELVK